MGLIKGSLFLLSGGLIRPTTTRERSRQYQRRQIREQKLQNDLMEEQNALMEAQIQAQLDTQKRLIEQQNKLESQAQGLKESPTKINPPQPEGSSSMAAGLTSRSSAIDRLEQLGELRKSEILTEEEFQELKKEILKEL